MNYDSNTKIFEEKKVIINLFQTKFTVVIFSDKGTKQAGELYVDVAEILNNKEKSN